MYGYAAMLGPEASNIVQYLVSEVGLNQTAPSGQISERLGMSETELGDGLTELEQLDTITVHGPYITNAHIQPKGAAWLYVDAETLGYDLQGDMLAVAESTDNRSEARPQDIESDTGLSPERLSIAALYLSHGGHMSLIRFTGRSAYSFSEAHATPETRSYVREHRA